MEDAWIAVSIYRATTLDQFEEDVIFATPTFKLRDSLAVIKDAH